MHKILIIDDDVSATRNLGILLEKKDVAVEIAYSIASALEKSKKQHYDLFLVDMKFPVLSGLDFLARTRTMEEYKNTPIIFMSGSSDDSDKVGAFSLGADDYMTKPLSLLDINARISRHLSKVQAIIKNDRSFTSGDVTVDLDQQKMTFVGEEGINLTSKEVKILSLLIKNPERLFSREHILNSVWGSDVFITDRTVDSHICFLRKKMGSRSSCIESISGEGYRFRPVKERV